MPQPHIVNYHKALGYDLGDTILCEVCGTVATDIHHIIPRSKFGKKTKDLQDQHTNLIALCRNCHNKSHDNVLTKELLQQIVHYRKNA